MFQKERDHDLTKIQILAEDTDSLDRKMQADNIVLCKCGGTAREVQACLKSQLEEGRSDPFKFYLDEKDAVEFRDVKDAMQICAKRGIKRISSLAKKD